ncbi:MAG: YggS family pyridoxal phosphate-dependent enzyme [Actinomycetota bacterium]|nr:YggS family pyridoxal phosphate-dependent enzyme [Actinomycetota bacterium]
MDYKLRVTQLKQKVEEACLRAGRKPGEITIIAATKYAPAEIVQKVVDCGITHLGENRAQDLMEKKDKVKNNLTWHFIGHLQSRKAKTVVPAVEYIHSIDKLSTLQKVNKVADKINKKQKVLIEVNVSGEESKYGMDCKQLEDFLIQSTTLEHVDIRGFMTMAPLTKDWEMIRAIFKKLRDIREDLNERFKQYSLTELSMGMSNDYSIAVEEGATMIRVGSVLFK